MTISRHLIFYSSHLTIQSCSGDTWGFIMGAWGLGIIVCVTSGTMTSWIALTSLSPHLTRTMVLMPDRLAK